jgi:hypothetical protein
VREPSHAAVVVAALAAVVTAAAGAWPLRSVAASRAVPAAPLLRVGLAAYAHAAPVASPSADENAVPPEVAPPPLAPRRSPPPRAERAHGRLRIVLRNPYRP